MSSIRFFNLQKIVLFATLMSCFLLVDADVSPGVDEGSRQIIFKVGEEVDIVDSKVDELFVNFKETWTMLDNIDNDLLTNFQETWTMIGAGTDEFVSDTEITESNINTYTLSLVGWLKTLYATGRGWTV